MRILPVLFLGLSSAAFAQSGLVPGQSTYSWSYGGYDYTSYGWPAPRLDVGYPLPDGRYIVNRGRGGYSIYEPPPEPAGLQPWHVEPPLEFLQRMNDLDAQMLYSDEPLMW